MLNMEYGYSINPNGVKFVFLQTEAEELKEISPSGVIWEFIGSFNKDKIEYSNAIVISGDPVILDRANFIRKHYGIEYHDTFRHDDIVYIRYIYQARIKKNVISNVGEKLKEIYGVPLKLGISIPNTKKQDHEFTAVNTKLIESVLAKKNSDSGIGSINRSALAYANEIPVSDVASALNIDTDIDTVLNISTQYGTPFDFVANHYSSNDLAIDFFNNEFECKFLSANESAKKFKSDGVEIVGADSGFIKAKGGYFKQSDDGEMKKVTDFTIKVHAIYKLHTGEKKYIVSLRNENDGSEAHNVTWENSSNKGKISDFVQKYGSFHFYGSSTDAIAIHSLVSNTDAPTIDTVVGYGWHYNKDICIFANGVFDYKKRSFTESEPDNSGVLLMDDGDGIIPVDANGNQIRTMLSNKTSLCKVPTKEYTKEKFLKTLKGLWKDDTGVVAFLMACGIHGSGMARLSKEVPMYYIRGITQSGKTTFCEILQRLVGYPLNSAETFAGTLFTSLLLLSSANNLPVFFTEGRAKSKQMEDKISNFRSSYDRQSVGRGRADMSAIQFNLNAIACMEGEEMLDDGATRTRCIQFRPDKKSKLDKVDFEERITEAWILDYFTYSYLTQADMSKYNTYYAQFMASTRAGGRNKHNLAVIFASAMCYYPEMKDEYLVTLDKLLGFQEEDEEENGTTIDIVKAISAFIQRGEYPIYYTSDGFVISWEAIQEYSRKYKQELSLKIKSYREHLDALGYLVDFYEVENDSGFDQGTMLIEGPKFKYKGIDKRLLCNPIIYGKYKSFEQRVI